MKPILLKKNCNSCVANYHEVKFYKMEPQGEGME